MLPKLSGLLRFPLSIILSYLQQPQQTSHSPGSNEAAPLPHNRDALSLLLTTKRFAYSILPLFRVPRHACRNYGYQKKDGTCVAVVEKYRFMVVPVHDPRTLLDRLNTRRLRGRISWAKRRGGHSQEFGKFEGGVKINLDHSGTKECHPDAQEMAARHACYQYGRTIEELAYEEWVMMQINHADGPAEKKWRIWPARLELLRFLDDDGRCDRREQSEGAPGKSNGRRRAMPSPFSFRFGSNRRRDEEAERASASNDLMRRQARESDVALLASYPRSGNTLLRTLLERITSIVTGSDTRPDRTLSRSLAMDHDLVGEGLVGPTNRADTHLQNLHQNAYDPRVRVVKTHFPERRGWRPVEGGGALLLVRNPYDAIDSYWNLCCTNTHTRTLEESVYARYAEKFEALARHEIRIWYEFHCYWIDTCEREGVPLLIVRYEDLVLDTEREIERVMNFLLGQQRSDADRSKLDSFWQWRIRHVVGESTPKAVAANATILSKSNEIAQDEDAKTSNTSGLGSYKPRSSSGGLPSIGKSVRKDRYSESVLRHMHEVAASCELTRRQDNPGKTRTNRTLLQQFGYDIYAQNFPENFEQPPALTSPDDSGNGKNGTMVINTTPEIRDREDPFGRKMTSWRRGETDGDTNPFPTVPR